MVCLDFHYSFVQNISHFEKNDETLQQVSQFTYLGCSISYQFSNDVEFKLAKYLQLIGTINPLNAELNPICHLLLLLGDLTFMGPCIVSIFQYISNKMQRYTVYLYLKTALHGSGGTSPHHQERIQLIYATHSTLTPVPTLPR